SERASSLFETTAAEARRAARSFSTQAGFATLAHEFFARFTKRFLTYHLDRELGLHVGGNGVFDNPKAHDEFIGRLSVHSRGPAEKRPRPRAGTPASGTPRTISKEASPSRRRPSSSATACKSSGRSWKGGARVMAERHLVVCGSGPSPTVPAAWRSAESLHLRI